VENPSRQKAIGLGVPGQRSIKVNANDETFALAA